MTRRDIENIINQLKAFVLDLIDGFQLSDIKKSLVKFEQKYMPLSQYSGNQSIDHGLFRKFLRHFDPEEINQAAADNFKEHIGENIGYILSDYQTREDDGLQTTSKTIVGAINEVQESVLTMGDVVLQNESDINILKQGLSSGEYTNVVEVTNMEALGLISNPTMGVIYVTTDDNSLFIYTGEEFINVTDKEIKSNIYVTDIDSLLEFDKVGIFTVICTTGLIINKTNKVYTLRVSTKTVRQNNTFATVYTRILSDINGWADIVEKDGSKTWEWHYYEYKDEGIVKRLNKLEKLTYAAL